MFAVIKEVPEVPESGISRATTGRLPEYLTYVKNLPRDVRFVSSTAIAKALELGEVQVRKDLSAVCGKGKPKIGYDRDVLLSSLETALDTHSGCEAVIVGAGKLGKALLGFNGFFDYGITIRKAFDIAPDKGSPDILPISELQSYCSLHQTEIGIICVPPEAAQNAADLLVKSGVSAIWCFAPVRLRLPENVQVQYENLALSLAHLHQKVKSIH